MALRSPKLSLQPGSAFYQTAGRSTGFVGELTAVNGGASRLNIQPVMNQKLRTELLEATGFQLLA